MPAERRLDDEGIFVCLDSLRRINADASTCDQLFGGYGLCSGLSCAGGSTSGGHVRREGVRRGQDGAGHGAAVAHRGEAAGVRVPVHLGRGEMASATTLN